MQIATLDFDDRAVRGVDHRQRRGVALEEHQGGALVADSGSDGLCQRARGVQFGDQHDVVDALGGERVAQPRGVVMIPPCHTGGQEPVPAFGGALPGAENGGNHLLCRRCRAAVAGYVEDVVVDRWAVRFLAFDQHNADRRWCHRHTKYDLHWPSQNVCCLL